MLLTPAAVNSGTPLRRHYAYSFSRVGLGNCACAIALQSLKKKSGKNSYRRFIRLGVAALHPEYLLPVVCLYAVGLTSVFETWVASSHARSSSRSTSNLRSERLRRSQCRVPLRSSKPVRAPYNIMMERWRFITLMEVILFSLFPLSICASGLRDHWNFQ